VSAIEKQADRHLRLAEQVLKLRLRWRLPMAVILFLLNSVKVGPGRQALEKQKPRTLFVLAFDFFHGKARAERLVVFGQGYV
jgi:hypothetical protein